MMNRYENNHLKVSLLDLISQHELQEMQESFSEVANVALRIVDANGRPATAVTHAPSLCSDVFRDKFLNEKLCGPCLPSFLGGEGIVDEELSFECLPGLKNYLVPLKVVLSSVKSIIVGYMIIGPVIFLKRKNREEFDILAAQLGVDPYELWSLVLELRVFSYKGIRSLLDMIENLTSRILTLAYGKLSIQKKITGVLVSPSPEKDISPGPASITEFLELFLDLVIDISNGHLGSIMLLDPEKSELRIKASCGLEPEIVSGVSLKLGEGIAGLAAQTKKAFLINPHETNELIAGRLTKPDLFSSMVVPIKCNDDCLGVVNISSDNSTPVRFDESSLAFVTKAAGLAGVALARLRN